MIEASQPEADRQAGTLSAAMTMAAVMAPIVLFGVALAARLRLAWASIDTIVLKATADDGYYYFTIARNIAHGHNVTFDGETVTNGFHPLWLALITPVFLVTDSEAMPVHVILTMGSVLGAIATVMIFLTLRRMTSLPAAAVGAAVYALHPATVHDSVNGVETPAVVALFAAVVWMYVRIWQSGGSRRDEYALGALCGLLLLARTDTLFIVPLVFGALLVRAGAEDRWRRAVRFVAPCVALLLPWVIWTLAANGTVVQVSGEAGAWGTRHNYLIAHGDGWWTQISHSAWLMRTAFFDALPHQYLVPVGDDAWPLLIVLGALLLLMCVAPLGGAAASTRSRLGVLAVPAAGVVAALVYHAGIRWHWRDWYFAPAGVMLALLLGIMVDHAAAWARAAAARVQAAPGTNAGAIAACALYVGVAVLLAYQYRPGRAGRYVFQPVVQLNMLSGARWIEANTPADSRIGSLNAGILGYYSGRTVVNLDGVVNADALRAYKACTTADYIREQRIDYVADLQGSLVSAACGQDVPTYATVATLGARVNYFGGGLFEVWRVEPDAVQR
jgi:4-amino-4-deoxy-L-arabinose transferase-like glycosyltransferase